MTTQAVFSKMVEAFLDHPFPLNDAVYRMSGKVGVALFPDEAESADALLTNAEAALKKAKSEQAIDFSFTRRIR